MSKLVPDLAWLIGRVGYVRCHGYMTGSEEEVEG